MPPRAPPLAKPRCARACFLALACLLAASSCWLLGTVAFAAQRRPGSAPREGVARDHKRVRPETRQTGANLAVGQHCEGVVSQLKRHGAWIDLGLKKPGYVSIHNLQDSPPKAVEDVLKVGDKVRVRVYKIRRQDVEVSIRDLPLFRKRPVSDFSCGEQVEGVVTGDTPRAVFVDVGGMIDGFLKKGPEIGAASPKDRFKVGQRLSLCVAATSRSRLLLQLGQDRRAVCRTCGEAVPGLGRAGDAHHVGCTHAWHLGQGIPPFLEDGGQPKHCVVGAVPPDVQEQVRRLVEKGELVWRRSSRPTQKGRIYAIGRTLSRHKKSMAGTVELKEDASRVLQGMADAPVYEAFSAAARGQAWPDFPNYTSPPLPSVDTGVAELQDDGAVLNAYVGLSYMHARRDGPSGHAPPEPVARMLGVPSCRETCRKCRVDCFSCDDCCIHVDTDDSASLLLGIQAPNVSVDKMAFFAMGDKAFPLAGGRAFLFDGKVVPHGVWRPDGGEYIGMALVMKK